VCVIPNTSCVSNLSRDGGFQCIIIPVLMHCPDVSPEITLLTEPPVTHLALDHAQSG
jgi:hypothetical protein